MNIHTLTYSSRKVTYNILDGLMVELEIHDNPYSIPLDKLFQMAARINKKRSFLFVSKVLGKHLPIQPYNGLLIGCLLASRYMEKVKGEKVEVRDQLVHQFLNGGHLKEFNSFVKKEYDPIIIGFAETATALGHSFFEAFSKADFFHTTRELLKGVTPAITFEEEHSHATSHRAYIDSALLNNEREIILVDDEITTGKTALNIIRSIHEKYKRQVFTVVSILDWRSQENEQLFLEVEKELGITIHCVSLLKGTATIHGGVMEQEGTIDAVSSGFGNLQNITYHVISNPTPIFHVSTDWSQQRDNGSPYLLETGRFGINTEQNQKATHWLKRVGNDLGKVRTGKRTLVLGTGEFMFVPMKIASFMGEGVLFHSTTRSPIYPVKKENYGAQNRYAFPNPEDPNIQNFVYNILPKQYDELFLFFEREIERSNLEIMLDQLRKTNIEEIKVVYFSERVGVYENE